MNAFKCNECEYESITTKFYCPKCHYSKFDKFDIPEDGKVYSYTTIHIAPPEFADLAPYHVVLVQLTDKLKVTGFMKQVPKIGDKVMFKELHNGAFIFEKNYHMVN